MRAAELAQPQVRPLINRLRPAPLESLDSLLQRLRLANHYREPGWLGDLLGRHAMRPNVLRRAADFQALGVLTGLDCEALIGLTLHRFAPRYGVDHRIARPSLGTDEYLRVPLWPDIGGQGNTRDTSAVCPACWDERRVIRLPWSLHHRLPWSLHHRLPWSLHHLTTCPRHLMLLHDRCPGCDGRVRLDVGRAGCGRCGHMIAAIPTCSIAEDPESVELTTLLWRATGCTDGPYPPSGLRLAPSHPLLRLGAPALLKGLWGCAQALVSRDMQQPLEPQPSAGPSDVDAPLRLQAREIRAVHGALLAAWRLLRDWPTRWQEPVRGVMRIGDGDGPPFPIALGDQSVGPPGLGALTWGLVDASWLGAVWGRAAEGYVWGMSAVPRPPGVVQRNRTDRWGREGLWLGLKEGAAYCQVGERELGALASAKLVCSEGSRRGHDAPHRWVFMERAVRRSLQELFGQVPVRALVDVSVPVGDVAWALARSGGRVGLVDLVRAVRDGDVPAFRTRPTVELCDLWLEQRAVVACHEAHEEHTA